MKNPRYVNEIGGIQIEYSLQPGTIYADPGTGLHTCAIAGEFGEVLPFISPPPPPSEPDPVPSVMTKSRLRIAMHNIDILDAANAAAEVASVPVQIAWAEETSFRRDSPSLNTLLDAVGMNEENKDALFLAAEALEI